LFEVKLGDIKPQSTGAVSYQLRLSSDYTDPLLFVAERMQFAIDGSPMEENLGEASAAVTVIKLEAPDVTGRKDLTVNGLAPAGSVVAVYDRDTLLGLTIASPVGIWRKTIRLTDSDADSEHLLRAEAEMPNGGSKTGHWSTPGMPVKFEHDYPEIVQAGMNQQGERNVSFDPGKGTAIFPYVFVPGRPFAVSMKFQDNSRVSDVRVQIGGNEVQMGSGGAGAYSAIVYPSQDVGPIYVSYKVKKKLNLQSPPAPEAQKAQLPPALQNFNVTSKSVTQSAEQPLNINAVMNGKASYKGNGVEIGGSISIKPVNYTPTDQDIRYAESSGIPMYGMSVDYSIVGRSLTYQVKGYMPIDQLNQTVVANEVKTLASAWTSGAAVGGRKPVIRVASAAKETVEITLNMVMKFSWERFENIKDLKDGFDAPEKLKELEALADQIFAGCNQAAIDQHRDTLNSLSKMWMTGESMKWGMMLIGLAAGPETFGLGTLAMFAATELMENALDNELDRQINNLKADIGADDRCEKKEEKRKKVADPKWIYDPSGYVYEVEPSNRIRDVKATAMYWDVAESAWKPWNAEEYGQQNPLITGAEGKYAWDVPKGKWKIVFQKDGYANAQSDELVVLPPHTDVNIPMVSVLPPALKRVDTAPGGRIDLTFDRHVIAAMVNDQSFTVRLKTAEGDWEQVDGTVVPVQAVSYKEEQVARHFRFTPSTPIKAASELEVRLERGVMSYNEFPLSEDEVRLIKVPEQPVLPQATGIEMFAAAHEFMVSWNDPDAADFARTRVKWRLAGDRDFKIVDAEAGRSFVLLKDLQSDKPYEIVIQAIYADGSLAETTLPQPVRTAAAQAVADVLPPFGVKDAIASVDGINVTVSWKGPKFSDNVSGYSIQWKPKDPAGEPMKAVLPSGTRSYKMSGLRADTDYQITIAAFDINGNRSEGSLIFVHTGTPSPASGTGSGSEPGGGQQGGQNGGGWETYEVGVSGKEIAAFHGALKLSIPDHAYTGPAQLRVAESLPAVSDNRIWIPFSKAYTLEEKGGAALPKPIRLDMSFDPALLKGLDARRLGIFRQDPAAGNQWIYVGGVVDAAGDRISAGINTYGTYAVLLYNVTFADLRNHWSRKEIEVLISRQIVSGMGDGRFDPNRSITRAEVTKLLVSLLTAELKIAKTAPQKAFRDVDPKAWYYETVQQAAAMGLAAGYNGRFRPEDTVTREEIAVMIAGALRLLGEETEQTGVLNSPFADTGSVSAWAQPSMMRLVALGLIRGMDDTHLRPKETATRAQSAIMLYRLLDHLKRL
jgi:hypothetical protein